MLTTYLLCFAGSYRCFKFLDPYAMASSLLDLSNGLENVFVYIFSLLAFVGEFDRLWEKCTIGETKLLKRSKTKRNVNHNERI